MNVVFHGVLIINNSEIDVVENQAKRTKLRLLLIH